CHKVKTYGCDKQQTGLCRSWQTNEAIPKGPGPSVWCPVCGKTQNDNEDHGERQVRGVRAKGQNLIQDCNCAVISLSSKEDPGKANKVNGNSNGANRRKPKITPVKMYPLTDPGP